MSTKFRYQTFVAVSGVLGEKFAVFEFVFSLTEQEGYPATSLDETAKRLIFKRIATFSLIEDRLILL